MQINQTDTFKKLNKNKRTNNPIEFIIHHSGGTDANPLADTSEHTAKGMELWHIGKGWEGLGYHYVIHKNGDIWAGRPEHVHGAHSVKENSKSIGICLSGNFDATLPTKEQEESLVWLIKDVAGRTGIPFDRITPHRTYANKTCYGNRLSDTWAKDLVAKSLDTIEQLECSLESFTLNELVTELIKRLNNK